MTEPAANVLSYARPQVPRWWSWFLALVHNFWLPIPLILLALLGHHLEFADKPGSYIMHVAMIAGINITLAVSLQLINGVSGQFSLGHAGFMAVGAYLAGFATNTFGPMGYDPDADYPNPELLFANPGAVLVFFIALAVVAAIAAFVVYGLFLLLSRSRTIHPILPVVLMLLILAWIVADARAAFDADSAPIWAVWSQGSLRLVGLYNQIIIHGAPSAHWLTKLTPTAWRKPITLLIALCGGGATAAAAGLIVGLPTLRLRGDYLAIATLGFAEIIRNVIVTIPALGAATGLSVNVYWTKPSPADQVYTPFYMSSWIFGVAAVTIIVVGRLVRSPKGKAIQAVREDEIAAAATGIDPTRHRVVAFILGAFFAGVAGALYVHLDGYLNTNSFSFLRSIEIVVMVTLGGLGSLWGAAIAAVALTLLPELLRNAGVFMPKRLAAVADTTEKNRLVLYALLLIVIMLVRSRWRDAWASSRLYVSRFASSRRAQSDVVHN
jgi:ABC-type branched-subunit amino acid transport system permease subunit